MKKVLASILLLTYLVFSSGVVINYHYCMDQLASTSLFEKDSDVCGTCGMHNTGSNGCCHDEVKVLKAEDDQSMPSSIAIFIQAPVFQVHELSQFLFFPARNYPGLPFAVAHPPPILADRDIYLQNRVFRI